MKIKNLFFKFRDGFRFGWARSKYRYIPRGDVNAFDFRKLEHVVILKLDGKLGDTQVMTHFYSLLRALTNVHGRKLFLSVVCPANLTHIYRDILGFDCVVQSSRKPREAEIEVCCAQIKQAAVDAGLSDKIDLVVSTEPGYRPRDFIFNRLLSPDYVAGCDKRLGNFFVSEALSAAAASADATAAGAARSAAGAIGEEAGAGIRSEISFLLYDIDSYDKHVSQAFVEFMKLGKLNVPEVFYTPLYTDEELGHAQEYLGIERKQANEVLIGVNPSGSSNARLFAPEVTASILLKIVSSSDKAKAFLLCHRGMDEYINKVIDALGEKKSLIDFRIMLMPKETTACDLAALVSCTDAQISVDTATVHLACCADIPQLCFYNNDNTESLRWAPVGDKALVVKYADANFNIIEPQLILEPSYKFIEDFIAARCK